MYSHTKKVGSLGRYGPRVGRKVRHEARKVEDQLKNPKSCPQCGKPKVKRQASGIWSCSSCKLVFAGGAYVHSASRKKIEEAAEVEKAESSKKSRRKPRKQPKEAAVEELDEETPQEKEEENEE